MLILTLASSFTALCILQVFFFTKFRLLQCEKRKFFFHSGESCLNISFFSHGSTQLSSLISCLRRVWSKHGDFLRGFLRWLDVLTEFAPKNFRLFRSTFKDEKEEKKFRARKMFKCIPKKLFSLSDLSKKKVLFASLFIPERRQFF